MGSMEIFLEKQGYGESPGLSSEWELSPNYPPPSGAIPVWSKWLSTYVSRRAESLGGVIAKGSQAGRSRALASRTESLLPEAPGGSDPSWCTPAVCSVDEG